MCRLSAFPTTWYVFHEHVQLFAIVMPLGWGNRRVVFYSQDTGWANVFPTGTLLRLRLANESTHLGQFVECRFFFNINGISRHPDSTIWREVRKHGKEIDVGICELRDSEAGILVLGAVAVRENVSQGLSHRCSNQGASLTDATMLAAWFSAKAFAAILGSPRTQGASGVSHGLPLSCKCGRLGVRTGQLRVVCLNHQEARPLTADPGWLTGWPARHRHRRYGHLCNRESGDLWTRQRRCGRRALYIDVVLPDTCRCHRCFLQRYPTGKSPS